MLLIFPPLAAAHEPPAGIARLAGALRAHGISCRVWDANLEGQLWMLEQPSAASDTWSRRALKGREAGLAALRDGSVYLNRDRYRRTVADLNRALSVASQDPGITLNLADYQDRKLSPVRSADLQAAARNSRDNPFFPFFSKRLPELLDGVSSVGISLNYLNQALCAFAMIGYLREYHPGIRIIAGGGLITSWSQHRGWSGLFAGLVDHLITGPGEEPLLSLLGGGEPTAHHSSPDYSGLPLEKYLSPGLIMPYSAASGCYWNGCTFCPEHAENNRYIPVPASQAVKDIRGLVSRYAPVLFHLLDSAVSPALLEALTRNPPGVPWYGFARIDGQLDDDGFCRALKQSGCVMLKIGLESGDQGVLDMMGKGIQLEVASRVLNNLERAGILVYCYLLFGTPGETLTEARRTLDFTVRHCGAIQFLNLAVFNMPLFSPEAAVYGGELFYEGDLSLYTGFNHPSAWHRGEARRFIEREFKRHPEIAAILRNDPPFFGSGHAPFLTPRIQ